MKLEWRLLTDRVLLRALWQIRKYWFAVNSKVVFLGALGLFSILLWLTVIVEIQRDILILHKLQPTVALDDPHIEIYPADNLAGFLEFLPAYESRLRYIDDFHRLAVSANVQLIQADYKLVNNSQLPVTELAARLVVSGQTLAVRRYADYLLLGVPSLAIENLSYESLVGINADQARLTLETRLYMRLENKPRVAHD